MKVLIVDDEQPARERLRSMIAEMDNPACQVAGEAVNGREALDFCERQTVDLVLMDIRMPEMDGLQAAGRLAGSAQPPAIIFTTAYDQHALEAFEANAVDYLLKPIRSQKLEQAIKKAGRLNRAQLQTIENLQKPETKYLSSHYRGGLQRVVLDDVVCLLAGQKYVTAVHKDGELLLEQSLKFLEEAYPGYFIRVHRNALVSEKQIVALEKNTEGGFCVVLQDCEQKPEVSRRHLPSLRALLK